MRLTNYFLPVLKESPSDAEIDSHQLMMRAGMISQSSSGIYSWLPLGSVSYTHLTLPPIYSV